MYGCCVVVWNAAARAAVWNAAARAAVWNAAAGGACPARRRLGCAARRAEARRAAFLFLISAAYAFLCEKISKNIKKHQNSLDNTRGEGGIL